jgi:hypothetical protein
VAGSKNNARPTAENFYGASLTHAEREALEAARQVEGLGQEAAVLRVKLLTVLAEEKVDLRLLKYGIDALVKVVAAEYRLSPKSKRDLAEQMAGTLGILADLVLPPER